MARHPAVRALACRRPLSARQPVSPKLIVGSGPGGAVVGAPSLQSPYSRMPAPPKKSADERRAPLKTVSVRQNAPPERKPPSASPRSPVKPTPARTTARKGAPAVSPESVRRPGPGAGTPGGKENVVQHVLRTVSAPSTPKRKGDENAARRATVSVSSATQLRPAAACGGAPVAAGTMASQKNGGSSGSRMPVPLRSIFTKLRA
ncbi:hypothetical protein DICSQDRAFT_134050 [Dichomitus squalens LYAD-421 SS1]|uniref:uncharacterized protein n=1 Tax=Dichomitus squalens (strain LYAD-421) TaxID=732165 RepID=UPI0004411067|nr:uncharacterized protein DICSQDRAFT_134050 [Dichomitus squalens LYAD-421 SS1]EJF64397.1 hypothetical protein DICSQDRAFT_134050 [Dichomitus squalens LYAD-421 SS1]